MVTGTTRRLIAVVLLLQSSLAAADQIWWSDSGRYQLGFTSQLQPIEINRMHAWVVQLRDAAGTAVDGAEIEVSGGMPAHDHGLPTRPQVTAALGNGEYLLEGLRFHMHGLWQLVFTLEAGDRRERVVIELEL